MDTGSRGPTDSPLLQEYVREFRTRLHARLGAWSEVAGLNDLWDKYAELADPAAIEADRSRAQDAHEVCQRARLRFHHRVSLAVHRATAVSQDSIDLALARRSCCVGGARVPFADLQARLRSTAASDERAALMDAENDALHVLEPQLLGLWMHRRAATERLQARSYRDLFAECRDVNAIALGQAAVHLLEETDSTYRQTLATWCPRVLDVESSYLRYSDLAWFQRGEPWAAVFDGRMLPAVTSLIERWAGRRAGGIRIDVGDRPGKSARAYTAALDPPDTVWLVARPTKGPRDLEELLHEAGHAIAFASVERRRPWEARYLAFDNVAETFAFLAGRLVCDSRFLVDCVGLSASTAEEYAEYASAVELMMIRRYCAKVLFECAALGDAAAAGRVDYAALMERAVGARPASIRAWWETDEELASVDYLRAWLLQAGVTSYLRREYGESWFAMPSAIEALRSLWRQGGDLNGESLGRAVGMDPASIEPLLASCRERSEWMRSARSRLRTVRGSGRPSARAPT